MKKISLAHLPLRWLAAGAAAVLIVALSACRNDAAPQAQFIPSTQVIATQTPRPDYPLEVACAGFGGTAVLTVTVGVQGKPTDVRLKYGSGNDALDRAAMARVPEWQFKPATRRGQPVSMSIQVPVTFTPPQVRPDACFALEEKR